MTAIIEDGSTGFRPVLVTPTENSVKEMFHSSFGYLIFTILFEIEELPLKYIYKLRS